jgi:hypothetical protein
MIVVERMIQEIYPDKVADLEAIEKRYAVVEEGLGFPAKKRYWSLTSPHSFNTLIIERQWPSMAAMEAAYEKGFASPEHQALSAEMGAIARSVRLELYMPAG